MAGLRVLCALLAVAGVRGVGAARLRAHNVERPDEDFTDAITDALFRAEAREPVPRAEDWQFLAAAEARLVERHKHRKLHALLRMKSRRTRGQNQAVNTRQSHAEEPAAAAPAAAETTTTADPKPTKRTRCKGSRYEWVAQIEMKCRERFGDASYWDRQKTKWNCERGYNKCYSHWWLQCCSRPQGPQDLQTYCQLQGMKQATGPPDPACKAQQFVQGIQDQAKKIPAALDAVANPKPVPVANISGLVAAPAGAPGAAGVAPPTVYKVAPGAAGATGDGGKSPLKIIWPNASASTTPPPTAKPYPFTAKMDSSSTGPKKPLKLELNSTALGGNGTKAGNDTGANGTQDLAADPEEAPCDKLEALLANIQSQIASLEHFKAQQTDDEKMQDPEFTRQLDSVLKVGEKLKAQQLQVCSEDDDDDEDDDESDEDYDSEADADAISVNGSALSFLANWANQADTAARSFDTKIHPHNLKWWRYRWEYTVVESCMLVPIILFIGGFQGLLKYLGTKSGVLRDYSFRTKHAWELQKVPYLHLVLHAASIAAVLFTVWCLHASTHFYDWLALQIRGQVREESPSQPHVAILMMVFGDAEAINAPFLGESYYMQLMDICFHLLGGFILFSIFTFQVIRGYVKAKHRWAHTERSAGDRTTQKEYEEFTAFKTAFIWYVTNYELPKDETDMLKRLGLDPTARDSATMHENFNFSRFFSVALHDSADYLGNPGLPTLVVLLLVSLTSGLFAYCFRIPFIFFLPVILVVFFGCSVAAFIYSRRLVKQTMEMKLTKAPAPWLTVKSASMFTVTICYILCYSLSRLLLSRYFWLDYWWIAFWVLCVFVVVCVLVWMFAGSIMKEMVMALSLPPNVEHAVIMKYLEVMDQEHLSHRDSPKPQQRRPS